jgi:hypothetical protein
VAAVEAGRRSEAADLWDSIPDSRERYAAAQKIATRINPSPATGGGALADFQPLIDLITTTVQPDTWDVAGGNGAMQQFPAGVYADAEGCLRQSPRVLTTSLTESIRYARDTSKPGGQANSTVKLRKISLPRLERAILRRILEGKPLTQAMRSLAHLQRVTYVLLDAARGDVILAGPPGHGDEGLSLDALAAIFHNQYEGPGRFGCSINPRQQNLADAQDFILDSSRKPLLLSRRASWGDELARRMGRQDIVVHGIDPRSHAARIIVAADHHMKRIGLGLEPGIPELQNYLDAIELTSDGSAPPVDVLRWWFTMDYHEIQVDPAAEQFLLKGRAARVLCENEFLAEQGRRVHTGRADPKNTEFTASFSRNLDALAEHYPVYRQLQGVFDLAMAAEIIRAYALDAKADWSPAILALPPDVWYSEQLVAREVDTIVRHRELSRSVFVTAASGGVEAAAKAALKKHKTAMADYDAKHVRATTVAPKSYESDPRWYWD